MNGSAGSKTIILILLIAGLTHPAWAAENCRPTPYDEIGPFYRPNAPIRSSVGKGYLLEGTVRSAEGCKPLPGAVIEFWLVNEQGGYDDAHRATVIADQKGEYSFASNRPSDYVGRLPHIHIRVTAAGHQELITQHYPEKGKARGDFDLVLRKAIK
ncbi:MAG: hypothetical protein RQ753_05410 [Desulfurivibrionaceae bacterium]|nr:hypothetical protein [Desulfobulbales bacterium]MDT8335114.1 hypothetical protein [Desulfurivibrionaceae bacterium]